MDRRLFTLLEIVVIAGLIVAVLYYGAQPRQLTASAGDNFNPHWQPAPEIHNMDPKLYKFIELVFIGALLIAVLYLGGLFGAQPLGSTTSAPFNQTPAATSDLAEFEARRIGLTLTAQAAPPAASTPGPSSTPVPAITSSEYQIADGDTCTAIAAHFEVSLQSLIALNGLDRDCLIFAGSTLKIPQPTPTIAP